MEINPDLRLGFLILVEISNIILAEIIYQYMTMSLYNHTILLYYLFNDLPAAGGIF